MAATDESAPASWFVGWDDGMGAWRAAAEDSPRGYTKVFKNANDAEPLGPMVAVWKDGYEHAIPQLTKMRYDADIVFF